jgi:hypothetical protein
LPPLLWFAAALLPMVISQVVRLHQTEPVWWLLCDYTGRCGALLVLAAIPAAREVAFSAGRPKIANWEVAAWILFLFIFDLLVDGWIGEHSPTFLNLRLGTYPVFAGPLRLFDLTAGIALVAFHEEVIFRQCAHHVFSRYAGEGLSLVILTSILFGAYHWWAGIDGCLSATVFGIGAMVFYLRSKALTPVILLHYIVTFRLFASPL